MKRTVNHSALSPGMRVNVTLRGGNRVLHGEVQATDPHGLLVLVDGVTLLDYPKDIHSYLKTPVSQFTPWAQVQGVRVAETEI